MPEERLTAAWRTSSAAVIPRASAALSIPVHSSSENRIERGARGPVCLPGEFVPGFVTASSSWVTILSPMFFKDDINASKIIGLALIIAGVSFIGAGSRS